MLKRGIRKKKLKDGREYTVRDSRARIFSPREWLKFFKSLKDHQKPWFDCLLNTGARYNEARNIKKGDIDFRRNTILLRVTKRRNPYSTGNPRLIPISTQYASRLKDYTSGMKEDDFLFQISVQGSNQLLKRNLKKIGIKDYYNFSNHNIRKTTECWLNFIYPNHLILLKHFGHDQSTALKYYITPLVYDNSYKFKCRKILGDLYM